MEILDTQTAIRHLGERLACEYTGAVPAGRVIRLVVLTAQRLRRSGQRGSSLVELTETAARTELTLGIGQDLALGRMTARVR